MITDMFMKRKRIKSKKILKAVDGQPCYLQFPNICQGRSETVVPCHSPFPEDNQGMGTKSHDWLAVPGCQDCHDFLDGRTHAGFPQNTKALCYHRALKKWLEYLFDKGYIKIS